MLSLLRLKQSWLLRRLLLLSFVVATIGMWS